MVETCLSKSPESNFNYYLRSTRSRVKRQEIMYNKTEINIFKVLTKCMVIIAKINCDSHNLNMFYSNNNPNSNHHTHNLEYHPEQFQNQMNQISNN